MKFTSLHLAWQVKRIRLHAAAVLVWPGRFPDAGSLGKIVYRTFVLSFVAIAISACGSSPGRYSSNADINNKTKFSVKEFGVKTSPRVTTSRKVRRGGGRAQIGKPYKIRGKWYRPREQKGYNKVGMASWYGPNFHGRLTANGEIYDQYALSAAHPTFPLPSYARVTNLANGNSVIVRVNDRGPYSRGRIIDLSAKAAGLLDYKGKGVTKVRVQYIGKARLDARDQRYLVASYKPGPRYQRGRTPAGFVPGVMLAEARPPSRDVPLPVLTFAKLPLPRDRPVYTGGITFEIEVPRKVSAVDRSVVGQLPPGQPPTGKALLPLGPKLTGEITGRFIISSYAAGRRINDAHNAARQVMNLQTAALQAAQLKSHWKRVTP